MNALLRDETAAAEWERLRPLIDDVIHELNDRDREAVLLRFFEGRAFADIGVALELSEDAARMRVDRALEKLHALLVRRGVTSTAAALGAVLANQAAASAPAGLAVTVTNAVAVSTAAAPGPAATLVQFMTTSKIAAGVAGVAILAVALGTATHETRTRQMAVESLTRATADVAQMTDRLRDLQRRTAAAEQALRNEQAELASVSRASPQSAGPANQQDPVETGREFFARHPEARGLWEELARAGLANQLLAHYRTVNLTPAQREQLEGIVVQSMASATTLNLPDGPVTLRRETMLTTAEMETQARKLVGDDAYSQLMTTGKALSAGLGLAAELASAVYRTDPLSAQQTGQMLQIFATVGMAGRGGPARPDWEPITVEAGRVLTSAQLVALAEVRRRNEAIRTGIPSEVRRNVTPTRP